MNQAHLHMVFNHFPIIGMFFGTGILIYGLLKKQQILVNTAYVLFIICMVFGKATMMTGEGAEEIVENLNISHDIIHEHEEKAELFMKVLYLIGLISIFGLINFKIEKIKNFYISIMLVFLAISSLYLAKDTGNSGGEIRHTEIRVNKSNDISKENN